jgi:predicted O-linked N-acetylglucosamine transferase (SPINDLY family)
LIAQEKLDDAEACFYRALQFNPRSAKAYNNLGNVYQERNRFDEAVRSFQQALTIDPNFVEAHDNLGITFGRNDKIEEAIRCFQQAARINSKFTRAHYNLGCAYMDQGRPDLAKPCFEEALLLKPDMATAQSNLLFCMNYDPEADPDEVFRAHQEWGKAMSAKCEVRSAMSNAVESTSHFAPRTSHVLRIGYISPDLRGHAISRYIEPVFANHDKSQFEAFCYAEVSRPDAMTSHLQSLVHGWRFTNKLSDAEVADQVRADGIDILVYLAGHTRNSRVAVLARKPAPVQVTWLGYMNTTGLTTVDYRLSDDVLDPSSSQTPVRDTEELFRLPGGFCCFAPPKDAPEVGTLPALSNHHLTLGSLHILFKLNARVFDLWSAVLRALPTSRLVMFHHTLSDAAREQIRRQFAERGIVGDRLDLRRGTGDPRYLEVYREVDVSLDAFPCTGGVTTCESLWMGVPMLTLAGVRPASRNSAALLAAIGLSDWIAKSPEEFVAIAVRAANELDRLEQVRAGIRERMLPTLCDAKRFTRGLEDAYRTMWRRWWDNSRVT